MAYDLKKEFSLKFTLKKISKEMPDGTIKIQIAPLENDYKGQKLPKTIFAYGYFLSPYVGDEYACKAEFRLSERMGYYLVLKGMPEIVLPGAEKEIIRYISKNVKGFGKKSAEEVVKALGADVIRKVADSPEALEKAKIGLSRKETFAEWCKTKIVLNDLVVKTMLLDLPPKTAIQIYETYGNSSLLKITENPYCVLLAGEISFFEADCIAYEDSKIYWDDPRRLSSSIITFLMGKSRGGNVCYPTRNLMGEINKYLWKRGKYTVSDKNEDGTRCAVGFNEEQVQEAILTLEKSGSIVKEESDGETYIYLKRNFDNERTCIEKFADRVELNPDGHTPAFLEPILEDVRNTFHLDEQQLSAVKMAALSRLSILTGRPGTGKTYVLKAILQALYSLDPGTIIELASPTGRAAGRINETTGHKASTLHSVLKIMPGGRSMPGYEDFMLTADYLIVDESSMIDTETMACLLSRVSSSTRLLFIGDPMQLPSVGPGNVFADMLKVNEITRTVLTTVYRQESLDSNILFNANSILDGKTDFKTGGDFEVVSKKNEQDISDYIVKDCRKHKREIMGGEYLYLAPVHRGTAGVDELNRTIQDVINPARSFESESMDFRRGDRVICTKNDSELEVYNGDMGVVTDIISNESEMAVDVLFDGAENPVSFEGSKITNLSLAYCLTVHKAQGSEAKGIAMVCSPSHGVMLDSRLIYTGLTRAREKFYCIGSLDAMKQGVMRKSEIQRYSLLGAGIRKKLQAKMLYM